ncbi:hypothetical protein GCM10023340_16540 [Nocardioides marinquilinus]|uniref:Glyoxalase-like domain-containing protein n=1 Tax=Nocardioides marinquilinus TaxID=1210400 RepID=A0ABP9PGC3_9ACTN
MTALPFWATAFIDVAAPDHDAAVAFWRGVTGYGLSAPRPDGDGGAFATLLPPEGDDYLRVQRLARGGSRVHYDLSVTDRRAAADRAVGLGATEVADHGHVVLRSPAGLLFCFVQQPGAAVPPPASWPGGRSRVDQVCVDVGPSLFDAELAFWAALTGFAPTPARGEFRRLDGDGMPLRLLFQRLDDDRPAGFHLDLAADDPEAEVARHVALGATVEGPGRGWTVLVDPAGLRYCVTSRAPG